MSIKLSFWIRPSEKNVEKKTPIYLRIQLKTVRTEYSIGESITIKEWEKKKQKVKGFSAQAEAVNGKIGAIRARALKIYNELLLSGILTMRVDDQTSDRLFKICNITSKSKSQIIREALWELFSTKYPEVI